MPRERRLVLFDFDGTLTTKDTLLEFIKFYHGAFKFYLGLVVLSPVLVAMVLKLIKNWRAKELVLAWYFKGTDVDLFNEKCATFSATIVPSLIRPRGIEALKKYQQEGDVTIVSASPENWVAPWCLSHNVPCIATRLEVQNNKLTGKISGKNCYGPEKVCRIKERYDLTGYDLIIAYGDSSGDSEMLALASEPYYRAF